MERYDIVKDIGSGNTGIVKLVIDKGTRELFAVKFIERGQKIDQYVEREIMNHRTLKNPNIVGFKEVLLTPTHLAIVMEYAAGGELYQRICKAVRFNENEARFFFQQLILGVSYCHLMDICHRDLKLENLLFDGSSAPRLKICDFGHSKSTVVHSQPKSTVGSAAYVAPEVICRTAYDGKLADVWSCGVTLYVMLVGTYPFEDPSDPINFTKTIGRILSVHYFIPDHVQISMECKHLLSNIFVESPEQRITIPEIKNHPWFLTNLPIEWMGGGSYPTHEVNNPSQSIEETYSIIQEAMTLPKVYGAGAQSSGAGMDFDYSDDADIEDIETGDDFVM